MGLEFRFGIVVLQHSPWLDELKRWKRLEELGFNSAWVADHFVNFANPTAPWFESWTLLSALASHTSSIRIGTLVSAIPLRNPAMLARQAMTLDQISNGRLELGLGAGAPGSIDPTYLMIGIEDWLPSERVARFREQVEIIDQCLKQRVSSYNGKYYKLSNTTIYPPPVQQPRPPLTIGALGNSMLKIAAAYGDCWNSVGGEFGDPPEVVVELTRRRNKLLDEFCREIGRDPKTLRRSLLIWGSEAETVFSSEQQFIDTYERYREIGISELIFFYPFFNPRQIPMLEQIALEVIPNLRKTT
ncbi:MAG: LLM class flavin-dependent oxidoreductase [Candidatus Thorarchaeota archaeon]